MTPSGKLRKTKKETSNKFESPFNFSFAEREGLINPSRRCHGPPCKKKTDENLQINLSFHPFLFAEREGFEPPVPFSTTVFKTAAFDHSAISPRLPFRSAFP